MIIEYNETFHGILGYRRMTLFINILNHTRYSEKYIHRLMKETKIQARIRRKKCNYLKSNPETEAQRTNYPTFCQSRNLYFFTRMYKHAGLKPFLH